MKRGIIYFIMAVISVTTFSCKKSIQNEQISSGKPALLHLSIGSNAALNTKTMLPCTRSSGQGHGIQSEDNIIQSLEILIFRNEEGPDKGELETYENLSGSKLQSLNDLQIKTTTGKKIIYVVANSHTNNLNKISSIDNFKLIESSLLLENLKQFVMIGHLEATLNSQTALNVVLSRLVARILLSSINVKFNGTPYEGQVLKNVKIYLINVHAKKFLHNGSSLNTPFIINHTKAIASDFSTEAMNGIVYDNGPATITSAGYSNAHYFYAYENTLASETSSTRFTRLVIQADLNGITYYYPININQEGYGYITSNGHKGIKQNTNYTIACTIKTIGSVDPDTPIEKSTANIDISVSNWNIVPTLNYEFK